MTKKSNSRLERDNPQWKIEMMQSPEMKESFLTMIQEFVDENLDALAKDNEASTAYTCACMSIFWGITQQDNIKGESQDLIFALIESFGEASAKCRSRCEAKIADRTKEKAS